MINNYVLHSAVLNPLLLFVLGLNAICTFVLYHCLMQLICLPDMRVCGPLMWRLAVNKMTGNLKFVEVIRVRNTLNRLSNSMLFTDSHDIITTCRALLVF